jgi:hypothetical protein
LIHCRQPLESKRTEFRLKLLSLSHIHITNKSTNSSCLSMFRSLPSTHLLLNDRPQIAITEPALWGFLSGIFNL